MRLEALAPPQDAEQVIEALFTHSTTTGIRRWTTTRATLPRHELVVELDAGVRVRIKVREGPSGWRLKPEYEDVIAAADALGLPALEVAREAERQAEAVLRAERPASESNE
jgi:uncharacterized protein (DUF111 family)